MTSLPEPPALKPIAIGSVRIDCPVILAPMTGVTDMPFRTLVRRYGSGLNVTEMIASPAAIRETRQSIQKAAWNPIEEPVSMQLVGCTPGEMGEAAKLSEDRGAAIIDINMGCSGAQGDQWRCGIRADARRAARRQLDRGLREGGFGAGHGQDAHGLGPRLSQRAGTGTDRRGSRCEDDHRARPNPQPDVQGRGRLGLRARKSRTRYLFR